MTTLELTKTAVSPKPRTQVPTLTVPTLNGNTWDLSQQTPENFTLIVFYRGYHCPVCRGQLRDLDRTLPEFEKLGVNVIAISSNPQELAQQAYDAWELQNLNIGYDLPLDKAREWGLSISNAIKATEPAQFSEPGIFLVRPDGTLYFSQIQTIPFARPAAKQLASAISYVLANDYPARGEA